MILNGYERIVPGTGKTADLSVTWRKNGPTDFRLFITFGKRMIERLRLDPLAPVRGIGGIDWKRMRMCVCASNEPLDDSVKATYKDGVLMFAFRIPRITRRTKADVEHPEYTIHNEGAFCPTPTVDFPLPSWVALHMKPDNSVTAGAERAAAAAAEARRRMA